MIPDKIMAEMIYTLPIPFLMDRPLIWVSRMSVISLVDSSTDFSAKPAKIGLVGRALNYMVIHKYFIGQIYLTYV